MDALGGILPAVVTPLDGDGLFAAAAFERLLERLYDAGVHGLYVCGQTGEGLLQPPAQRRRVAEAAVRCSPPGKTVIVLAVHAQARAGRWEEARATQRRINELIRITQGFPLFPAVKRMLAWSGIDCGGCLGPRRALDADEEARLGHHLAASSFSATRYAGLAVP